MFIYNRNLATKEELIMMSGYFYDSVYWTHFVKNEFFDWQQ